MTTIKEVADHAGVSVATVSRVVNNTGYVSTDLRERVQEAMTMLNYRPSALARSLRRQESLTIGVLLPQLNQPFFSTLAFVMEKTLFASDYRTLICSSEEDPGKEAAYIDMLLRQRVDGVLLVPTGQSADNVSRLLASRVPAVLIDRDLPGLPINRVMSDNRGGALLGARHLLELGHRRIAVLSGVPYGEVMQMRLDGIAQAFDEYGVEYSHHTLIGSAVPEFETSYQAARGLLQGEDRPTAVFALTDVIAVGVLHAAAELRIPVPQALSVVGFDNIPLASYSIPSLTTVSQPIARMGTTAVSILLRQINAPDAPPESVTLETELALRKSTAPYPSR
jgi:LacI family transcriptional regulator